MNIPHWPKYFIFLHVVILACCLWSKVHGLIESQPLVHELPVTKENQQGVKFPSDGCDLPTSPKSSSSRVKPAGIERLDGPVSDSRFRKTQCEIGKERERKQPISGSSSRKPEAELENAIPESETQKTGLWNWFSKVNFILNWLWSRKGTEESVPKAEQQLAKETLDLDKTGQDPIVSEAQIPQDGLAEVQDVSSRSQRVTTKPNSKDEQPKTPNPSAENVQPQTTEPNKEEVRPETINPHPEDLNPSPNIQKPSVVKPKPENLDRLEEPVSGSSFSKAEPGVEKRKPTVQNSQIRFLKPEAESDSATPNAETNIPGKKMFAIIWNNLKRAWKWFCSWFPNSTRKKDGSGELAPEAEQLLEKKNSDVDKTEKVMKDPNPQVTPDDSSKSQPETTDSTNAEKVQSQTTDPNPEEVQSDPSKVNHAPGKDQNIAVESELKKLDLFWSTKAKELKIPLERMEYTARMMDLFFEGFRHGKDPQSTLYESLPLLIDSLGIVQKIGFSYHTGCLSKKIMSHIPKGGSLKARIISNRYTSWEQLIKETNESDILQDIFTPILKQCDEFMVGLHEQAPNYDYTMVLEQIDKHTESLRRKNP